MYCESIQSSVAIESNIRYISCNVGKSPGKNRDEPDERQPRFKYAERRWRNVFRRICRRTGDWQILAEKHAFSGGLCDGLWAGAGNIRRLTRTSIEHPIFTPL